VSNYYDQFFSLLYLPISARLGFSALVLTTLESMRSILVALAGILNIMVSGSSPTSPIALLGCAVLAYLGCGFLGV
jgi:hypothetical protein